MSKKFIVIGFSRRESPELTNNKCYHHIQVDITNYEETNKKLLNILSPNISIDLLILNAGILGNIEKMNLIDSKSSKDVLEINLWANKNIIDFIINYKAKIRQVVAISSGASVNGSAGWGPYSISKAALNMLISTYSKENTNIHFSSIAPGLVDTAMQEYISKLKNKSNFDSINSIQSAKGTKDMPNAEIISEPIANLIIDIYKEKESGVFFDIRKYYNR